MSTESDLVDWYIEHKTVHEIHTSERKSFRACRRRWDWIFVQSYYPKMTAKPLEFGTAFHAGMEALYDPDTWLFPREVVTAYAIKVFVDKCNAQRKKALANTGREALDDDVQTDYDERVALGVGMLEYYAAKVAPKLDKGWKPVKVEIAFMVVIPHPETKQTIWCKCNNCWGKYETLYKKIWQETGVDNHAPRSYWDGLPVVYAGRLDMLAEDEAGDYWIVDWKTARAIAQDDAFLYLDDQIGSYCWALKKSLGIPVRGFIYHEQRKAFPEPPKKNKVRRLGCLFSVAKGQPTSHEEYLQAIMAEDREAYESGAYDEYLEYLLREGPEFYKRHQIHKSDVELASMEYNIGQEALDMIDPTLRVYPSPGRFGCNFCAFQQPCLEKNGGGDYMYALDTMFERRQHYYIREEPSTESKGAE